MHRHLSRKACGKRAHKNLQARSPALDRRQWTGKYQSKFLGGYENWGAAPKTAREELGDLSEHCKDQAAQDKEPTLQASRGVEHLDEEESLRNHQHHATEEIPILVQTERMK